MNQLSRFIIGQLAERHGLVLAKCDEAVVYVVPSPHPVFDGVSLESRIDRLAEDLNRSKHQVDVRQYKR